jgi:hypothetical protein
VTPVYVWLWRSLPGGPAGKLVLSALLAAAVVAVLFTVVFPAVEPLLPFAEVTVEPGPSSSSTTPPP